MPFKLVEELQAVIVDKDEALASRGTVGLQRRQQALHAGADCCFQALLQNVPIVATQYLCKAGCWVQLPSY